MIKKFFTALVFIMFQFYCFAQEQLVMDENASVRVLSESFNKINVSHSIRLILSQGNDIALAVSASQEKYKEEIKTVVKNGTLYIYNEGDSRWSSRSRNLTVYLSFREIISVEASGASDVIALGTVALKKCSISLSGASKFKAGFKSDSLMIELSGASKASLQGQVKQLNLQCNGASDFKGYALSADVTNAEASGASDIMITVTKELNAEASGASHIYYKGNPAVTHVKASGVSKISGSDE